MESKDTRACEKRDLVDCEHVLFHVFRFGDCVVAVGTREVELLVLIEDKLSKELLEVRVKDASIPVVSHTTTVHSITNEVPKCFPWKVLIFGFCSLVQVEMDQSPRDSEITVIEIVFNVPTDLTVLFTFLNSGMEKEST